MLEGERMTLAPPAATAVSATRRSPTGWRTAARGSPTRSNEFEQEGRENLDRSATTFARRGIDCSWEPTGTLIVAAAPHMVPWCDDAVVSLTSFGYDAEVLDRDAIRAEVDSPTYLGGFWKRTGSAQLDPARLTWGLAATAEGLGAATQRTRMTSKSWKTRSTRSFARSWRRTGEGEADVGALTIALSRLEYLIGQRRRAMAYAQRAEART